MLSFLNFFFEKEVTDMFNLSFSSKWKWVVYFLKNVMRSISYFWKTKYGLLPILLENVMFQLEIGFWEKKNKMRIFWYRGIYLFRYLHFLWSEKKLRILILISYNRKDTLVQVSKCPYALMFKSYLSAFSMFPLFIFENQNL